MFRFILLCLILLILFVPVGIPVLLATALVWLFSEKAGSYMAFYYLRFIMTMLILAAGVTVTAVGTDNIPDGPVLYVSNHRGYYDVFTAYQYIRPLCGTMSKKEWRRIPFLNVWMILLHCVYLDRSSPRAGLVCIDKAIRELADGNSFWICPEGTRNHKAELLPFHRGSFRPAFKTGTPIVPLTIVHTDDVFELHMPIVRPANVILHFGRPIPTVGLDRTAQHDLVDSVRAQIQKTYDEYMNAPEEKTE